jgi:hypothetical protein
LRPPLEPTNEQPPRPDPGQSALTPDAPPPSSGLARWLDRHAHPQSRTFRYLDLLRAVTQVLTLAGLLALVVQLHQANITAKRDAYNRSVDASVLIEQLELNNPEFACALLPEGPERQLDLRELQAMRYLEMNLDLHERLWQQHQEGIFDDEEWEPWQRWFRDGVVTGEMFPAVWAWDRDYYQADFAQYVDGVLADEVARRAAATVAAGGTPSPPRTLEDYAGLSPAATPAC